KRALRSWLSPSLSRRRDGRSVMCRSKRRSRNQRARAIEDRDLERDLRIAQRLGSRIPGSFRHGGAEIEAGGTRKIESLERRIGAANAPHESRITPRRGKPLGEPIEIDRAPARMQIEQALPELRHLGEAAGDSDLGQRMTTYIFEHSTNEVA